MSARHPIDDDGLMRRRIASINDLPIRDSDRKYH
jgi:nuclear transport factor 2 (NTF2) superfamily protein